MPPQHPDLTAFRALSFDCYGTLIDWQAGLLADLSPFLALLPDTHPFRGDPLLAVQRFYAHSARLWATQPRLAYDANLVESLRLLAAEQGVGVEGEEGESEGPEDGGGASEKKRVVRMKREDLERIGTGPGRWPAFADTVAALRKLGRRYRLVVLSNVDEANIARAVAGPMAGARFDAVYTAEAIGSYKPDLNNFRYLFDAVRKDFGVEVGKGELLHVARSLTADHIPAKEIGLRSVWIARGGDREEGYGLGGNYKKLSEEGKLGFEWTFQTLGEFADEVERQFAEKEAKKAA
ncbi:hypothetical protein VTK26DRAFT_6455 [Humicola hyalothermophila]